VFSRFGVVEAAITRCIALRDSANGIRAIDVRCPRCARL
jgi:hypothetical protein